jgi:hypothetical protein
MKQKKLFPLFLMLFLFGCGPTLEEKEEIAIITCNIMGESMNMDASMRIKEINKARENIKAKRFLEGDAKIKESFEYGLCVNLVLDDPEYDNKILSIKEEIRVLEEQKRIAREKKAEEARIAREKKAETERLLKIENTKKFNLGIKKFLEKYTLDFRLEKINFTEWNPYAKAWQGISFRIRVENACGLSSKLKITFLNNKELNFQSKDRWGCYSTSVDPGYYTIDNLNFDKLFSYKDLEELQSIWKESGILSGNKFLQNYIKDISITLTGGINYFYTNSFNFDEADKRILSYDNYGLKESVLFDVDQLKELITFEVKTDESLVLTEPEKEFINQFLK